MSSTAKVDGERLLRSLTRDLQSCATEADIVQVLYSALATRRGYGVLNLQVLEHEGWFHNVAVDHGVLQDVKRLRLVDTNLGHLYNASRTTVVDLDAARVSYDQTRGPGARRRPHLLIWVPINHLGKPIGSVSYQLQDRRTVPAEELAFLEQVHAQLGILVHNAYLNTLTRNQAVSLSALNAIARALSATHEEAEIAIALATALGQLLAFEELQLAILDQRHPRRIRLLIVLESGESRRVDLPRRSKHISDLGSVLNEGLSSVEGDGSRIAVPILEGGTIRGALRINGGRPDAYERSTLSFFEQVADEVTLALRNAWSYAALESQRRRLEVVNKIEQRLAFSLDRWSIMRTLREELSRYLDFDTFSLTTVNETPEGPLLTGFVYDSGEEQTLENVPLRKGGPSREAYETGRPVLVRRSPWAARMEHDRGPAQQEVEGEKAFIVVTRPRARRRIAARSLIWVPARSGGDIIALLTLQSYRPDMFDEWHVQLLEDVAAHVGLALANADHFTAAQIERHRLEALHELDMGVVGAADEQQIAEAFFRATRSFVGSNAGTLLGHVDSGERLHGWRSWGAGASHPVELPVASESTVFRELMRAGTTIRLHLEPNDRSLIWPTMERHSGLEVMATPIQYEGRLAGILAVARANGEPFTDDDVRFLETAAPVLAIGLRTVRLNRANELALAHSVRLQEVAGLAGHNLDSVAASVAEQAASMLDAAGAACWAFDLESRVIASGATGEASARRVLAWSGRTNDRGWPTAPRRPISSRRQRGSWTLIPLWYADRLVGAIATIRPTRLVEQLEGAASDFADHAAVAIENARLAQETRGRIQTLEAIAAFSDLDVARPAQAEAEMGRLIANALSHVRGALWLLEDDDLVCVSAAGRPRIQVGANRRLLTGLRTGRDSRRLVRVLRAAQLAPAAGDLLLVPVMVGEEPVGLLSAELAEAMSETRRLTSVLASQAGVVLARVQLVARLDREATTMDAVLSNSPVGVVLEGPDGRIDFANSAVERFYGVPVAELKGRRLVDLYRRVGAVVEAAQVGPAEGEPGAPIEHRVGDRVIDVRRVSVPGSGDQPERVLTMHEDVTRERHVQEAKDLMLRAIGHEVRSPSAAMRGTIASLLQWHEVMEPAQRKGLLESAYDQSQRLLALVEGQLIISQLETGRFQPNPEPVALARTLDETVAVLRHRYSERIGVVEVDLPPDLPAASCEATHLGQVLVNLVGNALEYTRASRVLISATAERRWLEVTVQDDGGGVPPDRVETLFTKLALAGQKRARGGLGLGLYLCRLVVERSFGGRIWLERTGPEGTTFKFTVPAAVTADQPAPELVR